MGSQLGRLGGICVKLHLCHYPHMAVHTDKHMHHCDRHWPRWSCQLVFSIRIRLTNTDL